MTGLNEGPDCSGSKPIDVSLEAVAGAAVPFDVACENGLLRITCSGGIATETIVRIINQTYPKHTFDTVLWDFTAADVTAVAKDSLGLVAKRARVVLPPHVRKTAFVVSSPQSYTKVCNYLNQTFAEGLWSEYKPFFSVVEALSWLRRHD
jgi:hypothetical protein